MGADGHFHRRLQFLWQCGIRSMSIDSRWLNIFFCCHSLNSMPSDLGEFHWIRRHFQSDLKWQHHDLINWNACDSCTHTAIVGVTTTQMWIFLRHQGPIYNRVYRTTNISLTGNCSIERFAQTHVKYPCVVSPLPHFAHFVCHCHFPHHHHRCFSIKYHFQSLHSEQIRAVSFRLLFRQHEADVCNIVLFRLFFSISLSVLSLASIVVAGFHNNT